MFVTDIQASDDRSPWGEFWFEPVSMRTSAGARVSGETAMRLSAVYGCVRVLAETMACLPFCLFRQRDDGSKEIITDHWLYRLIARRPNDWQTPFEWIEMMQGHLALRGNCYNLIIDDGRGGIAQLIPLHPDRVKLELLDNGSFRYRVRDRSGNEIVYARSAIWHVRGLSSDGYMGLNPIAVARETIGMGLAVQDYGARFFNNDAKPAGGWIEFAGNFKDKPARDAFRESWQNAQGGENRGKIAVLESGMKYHEIGINNKDSQFLEMRQFQVPEVCRLFRMPPHMIGDLTRSTNNNIEWQSLEFVKFTMTPWAERWEASIEHALLPEDEGLEVEFDFDNLERGDMKTRSEYYTAGINAGWLVRNEARKKENLDPIEGLDEPLEPMNMKGPGTKQDEGQQQDEQQPDDAQQGDAGDQAAVRLQAIALAAARRVIRKEVAAMRRNYEKLLGVPDQWRKEAASFYAALPEFVAEVMAVPAAAAGAYCAEQLQELMAATDDEIASGHQRVPAVLDAWEAGRAEDLVALAGADACTGRDRRIVVNVHPAEVNVKVEAPIVNAGDTTVNLPKQEAPQVTVLPAEVVVNAPVSVKAYPARSIETIERDDAREMTRVIRDNED